MALLTAHDGHDSVEAYVRAGLAAFAQRLCQSLADSHLSGEEHAFAAPQPEGEQGQEEER